MATHECTARRAPEIASLSWRHRLRRPCWPAGRHDSLCRPTTSARLVPTYLSARSRGNGRRARNTPTPTSAAAAGRLLTARGERPDDEDDRDSSPRQRPVRWCFDYAAALFSRGEFHACHRVSARGLTKPLGTGPVRPVPGGTGPARYTNRSGSH
jgi:hypothetical protein